MIAAEKQELAAQEANSIRAGRGGPAGIIQVGGIAADLDAPAIAGRSRLGIGRQRRRPADAGPALGRRVEDGEAPTPVGYYRWTILNRVTQPTVADPPRPSQA